MDVLGEWENWQRNKKMSWLTLRWREKRMFIVRYSRVFSFSLFYFLKFSSNTRHTCLTITDLVWTVWMNSCVCVWYLCGFLSVEIYEIQVIFLLEQCWKKKYYQLYGTNYVWNVCLWMQLLCQWLILPANLEDCVAPVTTSLQYKEYKCFFSIINMSVGTFKSPYAGIMSDFCIWVYTWVR